MSAVSMAVSVGTTPTRLARPDEVPAFTPAYDVAIRNRGSADLFLGDATVTTSTGWPLAAGEGITMRWDQDDDLHAVVASGAADVRLLFAQAVR